jgi:hypothetical protein
VDISDIINRDLGLLGEASHLVRETGDLLRVAFPFFKYWYQNQENGALPEENVGEWKFRNNGWYHLFYFPSYWKIPAFRPFRFLTFWIKLIPAPDLPERYKLFKFNGGANPFDLVNPELKGRAVPILFLKLFYRPGEKYPPEILQAIHIQIKEILAHELAHFADPGITAKSAAKMAASYVNFRTGDRFGYLSQPREVLAFVTGFLRAAKAHGTTFEDRLQEYLSRQELTPKEKAKIAALYRKEYERRGYGNRPRRRSA